MSQSDPAEMTRFSCPRCDRQMQARAEYAGRTTRCPGCQDKVIIPAAGEGSAGVARPVSRGGLRALLIGGAFLAVLGGAFAAWKFWPRAGGPGAGPGGYVMAEVDDLTLLPANAQALATVRLAEVWQRPAVQKALKELHDREPNRPAPAEQLEATYGLKPGEVERASLVVIDNDQRLGYVVARTAQPYDRAKVLARFQGAAERTHQGKSYQMGTTTTQEVEAVCFVSPHVLLLGREPGVKRGIDALTARAVGPLADVVELARGRHHAVFGASPAAGGREALRQDMRFSFLADVKAARGTLDLAEKAVVELGAEMPDEAEAKKLRASLNKTLLGARLLLAFMKADPEKAKGAEMVEKLLNALKISQKGAEVRGRMETDEETAAGLLVLALAQVPR